MKQFLIRWQGWRFAQLIRKQGQLWSQCINSVQMRVLGGCRGGISSRWTIEKQHSKEDGVEVELGKLGTTSPRKLAGRGQSRHTPWAGKGLGHYVSPSETMMLKKKEERFYEFFSFVSTALLRILSEIPCHLKLRGISCVLLFYPASTHLLLYQLQLSFQVWCRPRLPWVATHAVSGCPTFRGSRQSVALPR